MYTKRFEAGQRTFWIHAILFLVIACGDQRPQMIEPPVDAYNEEHSHDGCPPCNERNLEPVEEQQVYDLIDAHISCTDLEIELRLMVVEKRMYIFPYADSVSNLYGKTLYLSGDDWYKMYLREDLFNDPGDRVTLYNHEAAHMASRMKWGTMDAEHTAQKCGDAEESCISA